MSEQTYSTGGYWMVAALSLMLLLPPVIGHFVMGEASSATVHASINPPSVQ